MHYTLRLQTNAYHKPTGTWHCYKAQHGVRAVSRKHALDKGLRVVYSWNAYADRAGHPDWQVDAEATIRDTP